MHREMCLPLKHQNLSKTSEKIMADIDRVTVSLHILYTAIQETEGLQDRLRKQPPRSTKLWVNSSVEMNLLQLIKSPTRITDTTNTFLDIVLVSSSSIVP